MCTNSTGKSLLMNPTVHSKGEFDLNAIIPANQTDVYFKYFVLPHGSV